MSRTGRFPRPIQTFGPTLVVGAIVFGLTSVVRYDAGPSIGYFLVTFLFATLLAAALAAGTRSVVHFTLRAAAVWIGTTTVWGYDIHRGFVTGSQWSAAAILLASADMAVLITVSTLEQYGFSAPLPTAIVGSTFVAWYAMPVWGAFLLNEHWIARCHPALALNGALLNRGIWTEQPIAYQLTSLGQDIPYTLPTSVKPAAYANFAWTVAVSFLVIVRHFSSSSRRAASGRLKATGSIL